MADSSDTKTWDPCKPFLQFIAGLLAISTTLAVAVLTTLPELDVSDQAGVALAAFFWSFLAALAWAIIAGTLVAGVLSLFRAFLPARPREHWGDGQYLAILAGGSGSALLIYLGWRVAEVAIKGMG